MREDEVNDADRRTRSRLVAASVASLLVAFTVAGAVSLRLDAITFDETAHLAAGVTYLERGDFRLNPEHPPLAKAWAALPLVSAGGTEMPYRHVSWSRGDQWAFGWVALNGAPGRMPRLDPRRLLVPARGATLAVAVALGVLVFAWARELWGPGGGLLSLALYALSPTMLAHGRLVTTDIWAAAGVTAGVWAFWRVTRRPSPGRVAILAATCGLAVLTKFSALLLGPILAAGAALWIARAERGVRGRRLGLVAGVAVICMATAWAAVWAAYGFRFAASPDPAFTLDWSRLAGGERSMAPAVEVARTSQLVPEAYLYGLADTLGGATRRLAFLDGEISATGRWWYFPRTLMLKTPPAVLALVVWAVALVLWRRRRLGALLPLLASAIWLAASMASDLNIGHRHLAPLEPLLFVVTGSLASTWSDRRARAGLAALLVGAAMSFGVATPRHLSYVNLFGGGPREGWHHLLDSNVDWGQDLIRLRRWCQEHGVDRIDLAYFGTADPLAWGLDYRRVHMVHDFRPEAPVVRPAAGELVAVSVNLLQGLYLDRDREIGEQLVRRGWLSVGQVERWLAMRARRTAAGRAYPGLDAWAIEEGLIDEEQRVAASADTLSAWFEALRDRGTLEARAGDSILLMRVPAAAAVSP